MSELIYYHEDEQDAPTPPTVEMHLKTLSGEILSITCFKGSATSLHLKAYQELHRRDEMLLLHAVHVFPLEEEVERTETDLEFSRTWGYLMDPRISEGAMWGVIVNDDEYIRSLPGFVIEVRSFHYGYYHVASYEDLPFPENKKHFCRVEIVVRNTILQVDYYSIIFFVNATHELDPGEDVNYTLMECYFMETDVIVEPLMDHQGYEIYIPNHAVPYLTLKELTDSMVASSWLGDAVDHAWRSHIHQSHVTGGMRFYLESIDGLSPEEVMDVLADGEEFDFDELD